MRRSLAALQDWQGLCGSSGLSHHVLWSSYQLVLSIQYSTPYLDISVVWGMASLHKLCSENEVASPYCLQLYPTYTLATRAS